MGFNPNLNQEGFLNTWYPIKAADPAIPPARV